MDGQRENVIHQKHVDDERQSVTSHHQKGQSKRICISDVYKDAYQTYKPEATFYKPFPVSELGFWLRHVASGLRPSVCQMFIKMHIKCISLSLAVINLSRC